MWPPQLQFIRLYFRCSQGISVLPSICDKWHTSVLFIHHLFRSFLLSCCWMLSLYVCFAILCRNFMLLKIILVFVRDFPPYL
jgi:hypothetical protein